MESTIKDVKSVFSDTLNVFLEKYNAYGDSFKLFRLPSLTDQILIKVNRIKTIQDKKIQLVNDSIQDDFSAIINYSIIYIIKSRQLEYSNLKELEKLYNSVVSECIELLKNKNHDYGESWKIIRITTITDLIHVKLSRIINLEGFDAYNKELVESNYMDIINYAAFNLIKMYNKQYKQDEN